MTLYTLGELSGPVFRCPACGGAPLHLAWLRWDHSADSEPMYYCPQCALEECAEREEEAERR